MAIDTTNKKLGVLEWCSIWEPGLPVSPGTLGQDDKQQLLWGYPGVLWSTPLGVDNTKLSLMEWCSVWEPGIPTNPGTFDQGDKQQMLWGYRNVLWQEIGAVEAAGRYRGMLANVGRMMNQ